ncbi:MAG: GntR family transcriptional regulator [Clostridia bacterium]|nr:GntR family transcriptional regulator [Clostridia bacterium]
MFQLDFMDRSPLYEQIKEKMKALIISGVLKANERIPSVRELAQSLTINPNTIQKAYKDLELEGFIYSIRAKGNFVTPLENTVNLARKDELMRELKKNIAELMYLQVSREEFLSCIDNIFGKKEVQSDD